VALSLNTPLNASGGCYPLLISQRKAGGVRTFLPAQKSGAIAQSALINTEFNEFLRFLIKIAEN